MKILVEDLEQFKGLFQDDKHTFSHSALTVLFDLYKDNIIDPEEIASNWEELNFDDFLSRYSIDVEDEEEDYQFDSHLAFERLKEITPAYKIDTTETFSNYLIKKY